MAARPGNFHLAIFAGLSMEPSVTGRLKRIGKKK
jgi:hypothetical protein